jgi:hypothetical protein
MNTIMIAKVSIRSIIASGLAFLCDPLAANGEFDSILGLVAAETVASSGIDNHFNIKDRLTLDQQTKLNCQFQRTG